MLRIAPDRLTPFIVTACLFALGSFDTVQAQNLTVGNTTLTFSLAPGASPSTQMVSTGSTGGSITFNISYTASWLSAASGFCAASRLIAPTWASGAASLWIAA